VRVDGVLHAGERRFIFRAAVGVQGQGANLKRMWLAR